VLLSTSCRPLKSKYRPQRSSCYVSTHSTTSQAVLSTQSSLRSSLDMALHTLSTRTTTIIIAALIGSAVILVVIMGILHLVHKRLRKSSKEQEKTPDIELGNIEREKEGAQLPRAAVPSTSINTDISPVTPKLRFEALSPNVYSPLPERKPTVLLDRRPTMNALRPPPPMHIGSRSAAARSSSATRNRTAARHPTSLRPGSTRIESAPTTNFPARQSSRPTGVRSSTLDPAQISRGRRNDPLSLTTLNLIQMRNNIAEMTSGRTPTPPIHRQQAETKRMNLGMSWVKPTDEVANFRAFQRPAQVYDSIDRRTMYHG
jgi:hypothetical protein